MMTVIKKIEGKEEEEEENEDDGNDDPTNTKAFSLTDTPHDTAPCIYITHTCMYMCECICKYVRMYLSA
jgi:hypothetical protein